MVLSQTSSQSTVRQNRSSTGAQPQKFFCLVKVFMDAMRPYVCQTTPLFVQFLVGAEERRHKATD
jgi:hypothetical protein